MAHPGISVEVTITGRVHKFARRLGTEVNRGALTGLRSALSYLLTETKKVTPKDKGILRSSGGTEITQETPQPKGNISFSAPYAVYVHEDLTKLHASGTYAKFITRTTRNPRHQAVARQKMVNAIIVAERRVLRG